MDKENYFEFIGFSRGEKPRKEGITSLADHYLSLGQVEDVLEVFSDAVDYAKLVHIGLYKNLPDGWLRKKLALYKKYSVKTYPGGVPFEIAAIKGKSSEFFKWLVKLGFDGVEIAEDVIPSLNPDERHDMIKMALDLGLEVHTEMGKKHPDEPMNLDETYETIMHDLKLGVHTVVIERAELEPYINADATALLNLINKIGMKNLMFEPAPGGWPRVHKWCIKTLGPNVNLGNIYYENNEIYNLEWMRRGLSRHVDYSYFS